MARWSLPVLNTLVHTPVNPRPPRSAPCSGPAALPRGTNVQPTGLLTELAADLAAGNDLNALLARFLEPVVRLAGAQAGAVRVIGADGHSLELISELGLPSAVAGVERNVDRHCGACGEAADEARMVWVEDLSRCSARAHTSFFGHECHRMLAVPLQYRGELLGIYNLFFNGPSSPSPEIAAVLKSVGELLGLALHNAHLEAQTLRNTILHERQSMAAEVHDSIAQTLTFVKMRLSLLQDAVVSQDQARSLRLLDDVRQVVGEVHASVRQILTHFRTKMPEHRLLAALQAAAASFRKRHTLALDLRLETDDLPLSAAREMEVFHIVQEALANIAKHAHAQRAWVRLAVRRGYVHVRVEDDGQGLAQSRSGAAAEAPVAHYGLDIMQERAHRLGGRLHVGGRSLGRQVGTCVRLSFPLTAPEDAPAATSPQGS